MKRVIILLSVFLIISCSDEDSIPRDVYTMPQMESVMWDMILADRYAFVAFQKDSLRLDVKKATFKEYEKVFKLHHTDAVSFAKSYRYYLSRPDLTKVIFDTISNRANRSRSQMNGDFRK